MARFLAGKITRRGQGSWWYVEGVSEEDKSHPFAQQQLFDGNLSPEGLLGVAWHSFSVSPTDIRFRS